MPIDECASKPFWPAVVLAVCFLLLSEVAAFSQNPPVTVHLPPGYDFVFAVKSERESLEEFYKMYSASLAEPRPGNDYGLALANLTLGLVKKDPAYISKARSLFASSYEATDPTKEKQLAALGLKYTENILSGKYAEAAGTPDRVERIRYVKVDRVPADFHKIILGESAIHVKRGAKIKTQVDRVVRDWLLAFNVKGSPGALSNDHLAPWHEGAKISKLVALTGATVIPVWGTRARKIEDDWYAPDAEGVYRFEISEDKVLFFPTTIVVDDRTAMINDTHGISAIAWDSLDADLVIGCGDHPGKMDAAYYLAEHGVNVYTPTDRFLHRLIGTRTKGTIIGSAPVKSAPDGAVIGDQHIAIDVNETIVVSTARTQYPLRYYDTAYEYFKALAEFAGKPLKIVPVEVAEYGHAEVVVDAARKEGAKLIGLRVKTKWEHDAVAAWLKEDKSHRVVLFHTVLYPDGDKLFFEFPQQTSFGDIHPRFE
jgi:hypothetical protein